MDTRGRIRAPRAPKGRFSEREVIYFSVTLYRGFLGVFKVFARFIGFF